jgi:hypothetical protein
VSGISWQDVVVAAVAVVAVVYLLRRRRPKPAKSPLVSLGRGPKRPGGAAPRG